MGVALLELSKGNSHDLFSLEDKQFAPNRQITPKRIAMLQAAIHAGSSQRRRSAPVKGQISHEGSFIPRTTFASLKLTSSAERISGYNGASWNWRLI
jgi:hypothetical protein